MAADEMVTLFEGGTKEVTLPISEVEIPDMWHIAQAVRKGGKGMNGPACADDILLCWHIAGALKEHIQQR